jgi:metacaspase-1
LSCGLSAAIELGLVASVFISYRRDDSPGHAGRLFDAMRSSFGNDDVFMDVTGIAKGDEFPRAIEQAIAEAKVILIVIGPEWNRSDRLSAEHDWVGQEIALALKRRILILPVLVNGATFPKKVPRPLRRLLNTNAVELRDARWEDDVQQVATAVKLILSPDLAKQIRTRRKTFRILVIHDLATSDGDRTWQQRCRTILSASLNRWSKSPLNAEVRFFSCADLLDSSGATVSLEKLRETTASLLFSSTQPGEMGDGLSRNVAPSDRWVHTARVLGTWLLDERARGRISNAFLKDVKTFDPVLIFGYSVGGVVAYEAFARKQHAVSNRAFVTLGCPLGVPQIRATFGGRIGELSEAWLWLNFFNPLDTPFATRLRIKQKRSENKFTEFEISFPSQSADPEVVEEYLNHVRGRQDFWRFVTAPRRRRVQRSASELFFKPRPERHRALLVGINDYPNRDDHLLGCISDVYLMSAVLQEYGFESESIAAVMNERATSVHVREKLHWLLDDAGENDQRIFYFSGHGAIISSVGSEETTNATQEALATYDFDWSLESSINDSFLAELYSQLPFSTSLIVILDCGFPGLAGQVSRRGTRGLNPPEDVQHSFLCWNAPEQMWSASSSSPFQQRGGVSLGKAVSVLPAPNAFHVGSMNQLDPTTKAKQKRLQQTYHHAGPYLPIVMNACDPFELCLEFRHGTTWYGAFTYALNHNLRRFRFLKGPRTSERLIDSVHQTLMTLRLAQTPGLAGPSQALHQPILAAR